MAAVWEVHIISEKAISYEILDLIIKEYGDALRVREIASIDDWEWSNRRQLDRAEEITEELDKGKIITIEMQSEKWKSLGMYAEKESVYLYTFWINTDGFPELDADKITDANKKYYDQAYHVLDRLIKKFNLPFDYIAIGLESDIGCCTDIRTAISNSNNVIVWLIRNSSNVILPEGLKRQKVSEELDIIVFE